MHIWESTDNKNKKEDATLATVALESMLITAVIGANEGRGVAVRDILG